MLHENHIWKSGKFIDKNYKIVVDDNEKSLFIAKEIVHFLRESSGISLRIVKEKRIENVEGKYISIGKTKIAKYFGVEFDREKIGYNGFVIKTKGESVIIGGYGGCGTIFAGYEFLAKTIGFESFNQNVHIYNKVKELPLYNFDVTERPDFEWRYYDTEWRKDMRVCRSLRFNTWKDLWMGGWHSFFRFLPKDEYLNNPDPSKNHPKWYSHNQRQLCLHAQGDEREKDLMIETLLEKFKEEIKQFPERTLLGFTQEDAWEIPDSERWCRCPYCTGSKEKYGANSAVMIQFCNILGERLENWIKTNDEGVPHDREVRICFFAYTSTKDAPVKQDEKGNWVPVDESVVCRDNVSVFYAPIRADWTKSFYHEKNDIAALQSDQWSVLSERLYLWLYQTNFRNYLYPYDSYRAVKDTYLFFNERNAAFVYNEGQFNQSRGTAFNDVKLYLDSQLLWNVGLDYDKLFNHYFDVVYGPAQGIMRKYFDEIIERLGEIDKAHEDAGRVYFTIADKKLWDKALLEKWLGYSVEALKLIKPLWKTDRKAYKRIREAVWQESVFPRYALITLYEEEYSADELKEMKASLYEDMTKLNVDCVRESNRTEHELAHWKKETK